MKYGVIFYLLIVSQSFGQTWEWSPKSNHHQAAVQVFSGDHGGSGVYVTHNGKTGILTCWHIFDGRPVGSKVTVKFSDGTIGTGTYKVGNKEPDLGWVQISNSKIQPVSVAMSQPPVNSRVEFMTYGGPNAGPIRGFLRHWWARVRGARSRLRSFYSSFVMCGDSGGAILNERGQVVGIQSTGVNHRFTHIDKHGTPWPVYDEPTGANVTAIRQFCDQVCGIAPSIPPQVQPQPEIQVEIDYDKLAKMILVEMKKNPDSFRGPAGKDGSDGKNGLDGKDGQPGSSEIDYGTLASEVQKRLPPIKVIRMGADGKESSVDEVALGGELRLPPIRMEIQHPNGKVYFQERELGGTIALKLVPKKTK